MEFNLISTGMSLIGVKVNSLKIENGIVDVDKKSKNYFGMNINEPHFEKIEDDWVAQISIDFDVKMMYAKVMKTI